MKQDLILEQSDSGGNDDRVPPYHGSGGGGGDGNIDADDIDWGSFLVMLGLIFIIMPFPLIVGITTADQQVTESEKRAFDEFCSEMDCSHGPSGMFATVALGWRYIVISMHNLLPVEKWDIETYYWRNTLADWNNCSGEYTGKYNPNCE